MSEPPSRHIYARFYYRMNIEDCLRIEPIFIRMNSISSTSRLSEESSRNILTLKKAFVHFS